VIAGLRRALELGFTHALQVDADGQHDLRDIPKFLAAARAEPDAVICGRPLFDASIPKVRFLSRYITHALVWLQTLSFSAVRDSMCGFRLYPLVPVIRLVGEETIGRRMDFDSEILVRLFWRGVPVISLPTRVTYPSDGISHFDVWRDNVRISRMHTRLFFGMLRRAPRLLWQRVSGAARA